MNHIQWNPVKLQIIMLWICINCGHGMAPNNPSVSGRNYSSEFLISMLFSHCEFTVALSAIVAIVYFQSDRSDRFIYVYEESMDDLMLILQV